MVTPTRIGASSLAAVLLLTVLAGCSGDEESPDGKDAEQAVESDGFGSFVGEVSGTKAFVAVVAAPAESGQGSGSVKIFITDGRGLSEWFSGPISDGGFVADSDDGDAETEGELGGDSVTGTVVLPGGEASRYKASPPAGAAGLYELTISSSGEVNGVSAAGLAVQGEITMGKRGTGSLRMVDGRRLELALIRKRAVDLGHLRAGQVRLIVLSDGDLRGVAKPGRSKADGFGFFMRS